MRKKSQWKHKKYPARTYTGIYRRDENGEREFVLVGLINGVQIHRISFESNESAKKLGWTKIR